MKIKITGKGIRAVIIILGLVLPAFSYGYLYTGYTDKTEAAYDELEIIRKNIEAIKNKEAEAKSIQNDTEAMQSLLQTILGQFPPDIPMADNLLLIDAMEKELKLVFTRVSIGESLPVYHNMSVRGDTDNTGPENSIYAEGDIQGQAGEEAPAEKPDTVIGVHTAISLDFNTTYEGFSKMIDYIGRYPEKLVIDSVAVNKDNTTGTLSWKLVLLRYTLTGSGSGYDSSR